MVRRGLTAAGYKFVNMVRGHRGREAERQRCTDAERLRDGEAEIHAHTVDPQSF